MLFIRDDQRQILIVDFFLNDRMRADDHVHLMRSDTLIGFPLFFRSHAAGQQFRRDSKPIFFRQLHKILVMLHCQHFCRRHQYALIPVQCAEIHGNKRQNGLTGAYIALNQSIHDRRSGHVALYFLEYHLLCPGQIIWQTFNKVLRLLPILNEETVGLCFHGFLHAAYTHDESVEFFKNQSSSCRNEAFLCFGEMDFCNRLL